MYQSYDRSYLSSYGAMQKSPFTNLKAQDIRDRRGKVKGYPTRVTSNGKMLEHFGSETKLHTFDRNIEKCDEIRMLELLSLDKNSRYKTEMCRNFKERAHCIYGNQCQFAHGRDELRDALRNNKYKTKSCQKYWVTGYCAYGPRCNFLHYESGENKSDNDGIASMKEKHTDTVQSTSSVGSELGKSPVTSDEELAETVEDVILTGRAILSQMEKDKSFCDPKLEALFEKLKRALPPKRSSTPLLQVSNSTESSFETSRTPSLQFDKLDTEGSLSDVPECIDHGAIKNASNVPRNTNSDDRKIEVMHKRILEYAESENEAILGAKRDIFNVISNCSNNSQSPDKSA